MTLTKLSLLNFRNYKKNQFNFSPSLTLIIGPNASGKTNLLEAIYLLATGKSFRAEKDREMIHYGEEMARIKSKVEINVYEECELEIVVTTGEVQGRQAPLKKYLVNGVSKRSLDFAGNLRAVLFWPQDIELITGSPGKRRRYLDGVLLQIDREYHRSLGSYERGLRSRNRILERLQEREANRQELLFWDQLLIRNGTYITTKREEFIAFINQQKKDIDGQRLEIVYDHSIISQARLAQYEKEEIAAGATLVGPHRDDFVVTLKGDKRERRGSAENGRDLHVFGSRGEQRLAVLWLKMTELTFIEEKTGEKPILLLDDIFSELDPEHRKMVMDVVGKQQTIVTTTDKHFIENDTAAKIIRLT